MLFDGYFQLCVGLELARVLQALEPEMEDYEKNKLFNQISSVCSNSFSDFQEVIAWIENSIRFQDDIIRKSQYLDIDETQIFSNKRFLFDLITKFKILFHR